MVGRAAHEDDLAGAGGVQEPLELAARILERLGRALAQQVDAAVDVGVFLGVAPDHRVDHGLRLLRRRRVVEINERLAMDLLGEDREVLADPPNVERRGLP